MDIILGISLTYLLYQSFYIWIDEGLIPNIKPFNCNFCISFWVSFGLYLVSLDLGTFYFAFEHWRLDIPVIIKEHNPIVFSIPLAYYITEKLINRL